MLKTIALFCLSFASLLAFGEEKLPIVQDYLKAKELSCDYAKPLLLVFTESNGIGELVKGAEQLVCVGIDFPELNIQPIHIAEQNYELKKQFKIDTFPTLVLLDSEQKEITRFASLSEQDLPRLIHDYYNIKRRFSIAQTSLDVDELDECFLQSQNRNFISLADEISHFAVANGLAPAVLLDAYATLVSQGEGESKEAYRLREAIIKQDKTNAKGVRTHLAILDFQKDGNLTPLQTFLTKFDDWAVHFILSEYLTKEGKSKEALNHAQTAFRNAPVEKKQDIAAFIESQLLSH